MIRTFIYGSCVSRDTFEYLPADKYSLLTYVARQSLISSFSPAPAREIPRFQTNSPFQKRMLTGDWEGSLVPLLREHAAQIDLLLWDLCDERLGLRALGPTRTEGEAFQTRSVDGIRSGLDERLSHNPLIPFGSRKHRVLFLDSVRRFVRELEALGLHNRTVLIAPPWALRTLAGRATPMSFTLHPARANRIYSDYYFTIRHATSIRKLTVPAAEVLADDDHPWGVAPFHYVEDVYISLVQELARFSELSGL